MWFIIHTFNACHLVHYSNCSLFTVKDYYGVGPIIIDKFATRFAHFIAFQISTMTSI